MLTKSLNIFTLQVILNKYDYHRIAILVNVICVKFSNAAACTGKATIEQHKSIRQLDCHDVKVF